jgi:hypothetical protein
MAVVAKSASAAPLINPRIIVCRPFPDIRVTLPSLPAKAKGGLPL